MEREGGGGGHSSVRTTTNPRSETYPPDRQMVKGPSIWRGNEWVYVVINDMIIVPAIRHFGPTAIKSPLHTDKPLAYPSSSGTSVIKIRLN